MSIYIFETKTFERSYKGVDFTVKLHFEEEDLPIDDLYEYEYTEKELKEVYDKLDRYDLVYFCAHMECQYNDIHLSDDYLGGCLYDSYDQFVNEDDYFGDMVSNVLTEGYKELKALKEQLNHLTFERDE